MPAIRNIALDLSSFCYKPVENTTLSTASSTRSQSESRSRPSPSRRTSPSVLPSEPRDVPQLPRKFEYPLTPTSRSSYRTPAGKRVPRHHWDVYDLILQIPAGKVSTYKAICTALGTGSPRSVGSALRNNPFAPYVPCHRVVASNFFVGGYCGEWTDLKAGSLKALVGEREGDTRVLVEGEIGSVGWNERFRGKGHGAVQREKLKMLVREGVPFDEGGKLFEGEKYLWRGDEKDESQ
ncbi:hypothetical protein EW146_g3257 [Bondarzewia mesenterica]|uniref:Methylated-DNA--protein-cysteine methyltransferase n=1 Tax=Bondarzewia mesenterica TaxID=1095465 RepID=A0A4S4LY90_9AGAM|nr:hypothetical protein EW146_g3257 [Bondarzewia mesenterica]